MRAALKARVERLEKAAGVDETVAFIVLVPQTLDEVRQGVDLWDSAVTRDLLPLAVLEGRRQVVLLPEPCQTAEEWYLLRDAMEDYKNSLPTCATCGIKLYQSPCVVCTARRQAAPKPPQSGDQVDMVTLNGHVHTNGTPPPRPAPTKPEAPRPEPTGPQPQRCTNCGHYSVMPVGTGPWRCGHCHFY